MRTAVVWFRDDLRLRDHPALQAALKSGLAPLPVYIHAPHEEGEWAPGAASDAWRRQSLAALDADLRRRGSRLHVFAGDSLALLRAIAGASGAEAVFWSRRYEPHVDARDERIRRALRGDGLRAEAFNGGVLFEPWQLHTRGGDPYRVFTPFWKAARSRWAMPRLQAAPEALPALPAFPALPRETALDAIPLPADPAWARRLRDRWTPGEAGAERALETFVGHALARYRAGRDFPAEPLTSRLSPHLHFGEITPWRILDAVERAGAVGEAGEAFARELGWREFARHVLHHFPETPRRNFGRRFDHFDWAAPDPGRLRAWQQGCTGVPLVDAGMRELWTTGWMHNRVRMVVAGFLTKHLRMHWSHGARWFWHTLVDADLASNTLGWQWAAGTGVDAAPYFRVFNPVLQGRRFDPDGTYVARWVPELATLPAALRHAPWEAGDTRRAMGKGYPARPMVDLDAGRREALDALSRLPS